MKGVKKKGTRQFFAMPGRARALLQKENGADPSYDNFPAQHETVAEDLRHASNFTQCV
jgi:hypothetical protein